MSPDPAQKKAIAHKDGPMLVLAGPGSGKTTVIVGRARALIEKAHIPPAHILVVTFSRASAREMKERFDRETDGAYPGVTFGTFHGIFFGILKAAYNLSARNILSEKEKREILNALILSKGRGLEGDDDLLADIAREISLVKERRISVDTYYSACCPDEVFRAVYRGYTGALRERRLLDFDDMLLYCARLFEKRPDILAFWQKKFTYILVDEFQDISPLQYEIIRRLASPEDNLFIVGDDDQSIYRFRGARPEIMLNFRKDYPDAACVVLNANYRSREAILDPASRLIGCNKKRFSKKGEARKKGGEPAMARLFETPRDEYRFLAGAIRQIREKGEPLSETAILFRTNLEAEYLVRVLMEYQIPFRLKERIQSPFSHWICRDILSYLHFAAGENSRANFLRIMNRPNRYIARDMISAKEVDLYALSRSYPDKEWMEDRILELATQMRILKSLPPFAAITFLRRAVKYDEYIKDYASKRNLRVEELAEILDTVHESARDYRTLDEWEAFMDRYEKEMKEKASSREEEDGVCLSTLHQAKGLEFDRVFIINVNEETIPYRKAVLPEAIEEERRLFYVGMTRARESLVLCCVKSQFEKKKMPSRFLKEAGLSLT